MYPYGANGRTPNVGIERRGGGFKTLYGTGHERFNEETKQLERVGGVRWTIKDGIVYDAPRLLADVAAEVDKAKAEQGRM